MTRVLPLFLALSLWSGCSDKRTPEQQIAAVVDEGVTALEKKDVNAAGDLLADGYRDAMGRDRKKMKALAFFLLRRGSVHIRVSDENIVVDESGQKARMTAKVTGVQSTLGKDATVSDLLPRGRSIEVTVDFVREGDDWLITAIDGDGFSGSDDL